MCYKNLIKVELGEVELFKPVLTYLEYILRKFGVQKDQKKVSDVLAYLKPCNISEVRSFVVLLNYFWNIFLRYV